jgi:phage baseplate assembly protein W
MSSRPSRAEVTIKSNKKIEFFSDFVNSFAKTPVGDQLARVINERSINQALKNLIFTNYGERLFQPGIGSSINALLFEQNVESNLSTIQNYIERTINFNEPRVELIDVVVDSTDEEHEVAVSITYRVINRTEQVNFSFIFRRVR